MSTIDSHVVIMNRVAFFKSFHLPPDLSLELESAASAGRAVPKQSKSKKRWIKYNAMYLLDPSALINLELFARQIFLESQL